jgi:hypothetical protein
MWNEVARQQVGELRLVRGVSRAKAKLEKATVVAY